MVFRWRAPAHGGDYIVNGGYIRVHQRFIKVGESVVKVAPKRNIQIDAKHTSGLCTFRAFRRSARGHLVEQMKYHSDARKIYAEVLT